MTPLHLPRLLLPLALLVSTACSSGKGEVDAGDTTDGADGADGADGTDGSDGTDGTNPATGCDLEGQAFFIDFESATIVAPANVGPILISQLDGDLLLQVQAQEASSIDAILGFAVEGEQDPCVETADLPTSDWADPVLTLGPQDVTLNLAGAPVPLSSFYLAIEVAPECDSLTAGVAEAELDARPLNDVVGGVFGTDTPDELCETLGGLGVTCGPCTSDGAPYCADLLIEDLGGPAVDTALVPISASDVAGNAACD